MLSKIFGQLSWNSPNWIKQLQFKAKQNPKQFWGRILVGIVCLIVIGWLYHWYQSLPKPERITAKITTPKITPLEAELIPDNLTINFGIAYGDEVISRSVAPLSLVGKAINKDISISPAIEGQWRWDSDSRLVFTPQTDWPAAQSYEVTFNKGFFTPGTKMAAWHYTFTTMPLTANIKELKFYQDPLNPKLRQVVATIEFGFPIDAASLSEHIHLNWQALKSGSFAGSYQDVKFTLTYDKFKRVAYLLSESITLPSSERFIQLTLDQGIKSLTGPGKTTQDYSQTVLIPDASSYLKVSNLMTSIVRNPKDQPEQVLTLETTLGITATDLNNHLHVYVLPQDYPATSAEEAKPNYQWQDPGEVTSAILALAKPLTLQPLPTEHDYSSLHSYQYHALTPAYIYVTIDKGLKGFGDFELSRPYTAILQVPAYPQEISFLHKGALLALGSEEKLSVLVRGLEAVKFDVARVLPNDINHLITQTSGDFSNPSFINYSFNQDNISQIYSQVQPFDASDPAKAQYTALDFTQYLAKNATANGPRGLFLLNAHGWDPSKKIMLDTQASRLILITDLGIIVKDNADGTHDVFVQSITKGTPVNQATVTLLGKNGLPILSRRTNADGNANFPSVNDITNEREPTVYLAQNGGDISFIPYSHFDRKLNYSRFDVGGVTSNGENKSGITAYVFTDRGIYRPGDTVHAAMIVKQPYAMPQAAGLPLEATIVDPRGVTVKDEKVTLNETGYLTFDFQTSNTSPTGQYNINLFIVKDNHPSSLIGSANVQVNEFLPDRMRINAKLSQEVTAGWMSPSDLSAKVGLWNLYGAPAVNHRITGKITLIPQTIHFNQFPDYTFVDPLFNPKSPPKMFAESLSETTTDSQGQADMPLKLDRFDKATYQLNVFIEGFEAEGGRSVTTQVNTLVSPLKYLVGYKASGDLTFIKQNSSRAINLIAIDPQLKQIDLNNLSLQLYKLQPISTLVKKPDGTYQYQSIEQSTLIKTTPFVIHKTGDSYTLPAQDFGDYLLTIVDQQGTELSKLKFSIVGESKQPLPNNAELSLKLNKSEFNAGDEIEMQITAPYTGAGLITIERDKVYASQWFKANNTSSIQKIKIPADFKGDGYVNVTFVRDFNSPDIFMNPLSFSVAPFSVSHKDHDIQVDLTVPTLARPGTPLTINYKTDIPSKLIVFAVDEGILQVTRFPTPNPTQFFFQKHALDVVTQQIVDQILPKYIAERELSSVGGDHVAERLANNLNPFKRATEAPVVYWSGIIDSDSTAKQLIYNIPDYFNGSLRIMAVAVANAAVGSASQSTTVKGYFVINPNVPTFVAPGDEFEVTASIANNVEGSGSNARVAINLTASPELKLIDADNQQLVVPEGEERSIHFKVKASEKLGSAQISFTANIGDKSSKIASTLSVRPAIPYMNNMTSGYSKDASKSLKVIQTFYPEYRNVEMAVSRSPLILAVGLKNYLNDYPYGCVEQLVSKALLWLAMADQPWFITDSAAIHLKVQKTIEMLNQRQMSSGAFNYWPEVGTTSSNDFASVYAMHFLTEAKALGYAVPSDVFSAGIGYLKDYATQDISNLEDARLHAYVIYVLTRNEIVTTNYLTNLLAYFEQHKDIKWREDITSAYIASVYKLLKNDDEANKIINYYEIQTNKKEDVYDFYNSDIANAQYIYLISKHFPDKLDTNNINLILPLVNALNSDTISTILTGYSSLALSNFDAYFATENTAPITINDTSSSNDKYQHTNIAIGVPKVTLTNPSKQGYFYQLSQAGFDKQLPTSVVSQGIEVYREYKTLNNTEVSNPMLGDEIIVNIRIRSLDNKSHGNIAIVDLFPGGFEVIRDSIKAPIMDYADLREDRIIFFGSINPESNMITYHIKPTSVGTFTVPPIFATAMYNPMVKSVGVASSLTVVGN